MRLRQAAKIRLQMLCWTYDLVRERGELSVLALPNGDERVAFPGLARRALQLRQVSFQGPLKRHVIDVELAGLRHRDQQLSSFALGLQLVVRIPIAHLGKWVTDWAPMAAFIVGQTVAVPVPDDDAN